jgi:geranylgeranyl diphosphate synthase type I
MELYTATWKYLAALPTVQEWPELKQFLQRVIASRPPHWRLAALACQATGGTPDDAIPAVAAMGALFLNIVLIDDMLDADPKGQHHRWGHAATANLAAALQAIGFEAVMRSPLPQETQALILNRLNQMMLQTTLGQYWDGQNPCDEESYWRVTRTKSSPYFGTALFVGALMGGAAEITALRLGEVGAIYGEMIQINDDLNDVMEVPANADWLQGRYSLPILFATLVPHPDRERFLALRRQIGEESALQEAQEILIRCGAMSYGVDQLLQRYQQANGMLRRTQLAQRTHIQHLVDEVIVPVQRLLAQVNASTPLPIGVLHPH